ncbi:hypothetical protein SCHPADRAFT_991838 [Schizopora paradoxa]|uniref:Mitochondrial import inner membrane translocase subunit TIM21 n=1 Tax=Schizopora paradoxa TaxID=27342 RepID=A0A0H2STN8_9AGAM|nr:hypothetical protein SCHPADRAFT_991838 [Schizopora paradoxa]
MAFQHRISFGVALSRSWFHSHPRPRLRTRIKFGCTDSRSFSSTPRVPATHKDTPTSSLLSQTLDQRQRLARDSQQDNVGPFNLGTVQRPMGVGEKPMKKWSELDGKGKVIRTTQRTTNLGVILLGAGLTAILAYALSSELFARNSPTVLYGEACKRIEASEEILQCLPGKLTFHNNPPSSSRPRHRNRHVSSQLAVDSQGREHLILNFFIRTSPERLSSADEEEGYVDRLFAKIRVIADESWTWDEIQTWSLETYARVKEKGRRLFWYLTGESGSSPPQVSPAHTSPSAPPPRKQTHIGRQNHEEEAKGGLWSSITGLFSGLGRGLGDGSASAASSNAGSGWRGVAFEEAEVHCDLVKDGEGNFVWRYILVDMPNSRGNRPHRIFVERTSDVREGEAVMRWY